MKIMSANNKNNKNSNSSRKRFSDDQIKSLESTFESESRPELHLKQHLANKLGLHPRQIAIWFQNKRARSKSKQIEGEYSVLKSTYDDLAQRFQALRKDNQTLLIQVQKLRKMVDNKDGEGNGKNRVELDINSHDLSMGRCVPNGRGDYMEELQPDVLNMPQFAESSLASPENGCSFQSCTFLHNTGATAQWWDF